MLTNITLKGEKETAMIVNSTSTNAQVKMILKIIFFFLKNKHSFVFFFQIIIRIITSVIKDGQAVITASLDQHEVEAERRHKEAIQGQVTIVDSIVGKEVDAERRHQHVIEHHQNITTTLKDIATSIGDLSAEVAALREDLKREEDLNMVGKRNNVHICIEFLEKGNFITF